MLSIYFFLSKVLTIIFLPVGISLLLILIGLIFKRKYFFIFAFFILWIFSLGLISNLLWTIVEYPWKREDFNKINYSDAIVVLSGVQNSPLRNKNIIEWEDPDRFNAGINLLKNDKAQYLIFTGGFLSANSDNLNQGEIYRNEAIARNISLNKLLITPKVRNTLEEAIEVKRILTYSKKYKMKKIILVTSAYHMNRAKKIFERKKIIVQPFPVDFKSKDIKNSINSIYSLLPNAKSLYLSSIALKELMGRIVFYSW